MVRLMIMMSIQLLKRKWRRGGYMRVGIAEAKEKAEQLCGIWFAID